MGTANAPTFNSTDSLTASSPCGIIDVAKMVSLYGFNPACYIPTTVNNYLPSAVACAPPPSYFSSAYNTITSPFGSTYSTVRAMLQALVGLPFLSLLLIPTTGSWSTTVNFFFFYLTWYTLILSHPPLRVELIGSLAIRVVFYLLPSAAFFAFDFLFPSAAVSAKAQGSSGLPMKNASRSRSLQYLRIVGWSVGNVLLATLAQFSIEFLLTKVLLVHSALRVTTTLPTPFAIIIDLARGYIMREILTYVIHRYTLHESRSFVAKAHNSWYHSLEAPFPLSASYDHPLAYLLHNFIPTYAPAFLFRFHMLTYLMFLTIISLEETFAYSGYSTVPTNFILGGIARRTDDHLLHGDGNFGRLGLVDWVMNTTIGGSLIEDVGDEAEKHDVEGRAKRAGRKGLADARTKANGVFEGAKSRSSRRQRSDS